MQLILESIPLSSILFEEDTYYFSPESFPGSFSTQLITSIRTVGVLHPPLVQAKGDQGKYKIISGFKRLAILQNLAPDAHIHSLVLPPSCSLQELYISLYHHWVADRQPTIVEQAGYFKKARHILNTPTLLSFAQNLGHKPTIRVVDDIITLLDLEQNVLLGLHTGAIHPRTARKISNLDHLDQQRIAGLITCYRLGGSKQQKMVDLGMELIMREKISWRDIEEKWMVEDSYPEINIPQQAAKFLEWLFKQCYPRSSSAESEFSEFVTSLKLPSEVEVSHAPFFENDELRLTITYQNREELLKNIPALHLKKNL